MRLHPLRLPNGETVDIRESERGFVCPICGYPALAKPPRDPASGMPSFEWCPCCDTQAGWDDLVPPDSPIGTQAWKWEELREHWLRDVASHDAVRDQLANLGLEQSGK